MGGRGNATLIEDDVEDSKTVVVVDVVAPAEITLEQPASTEQASGPLAVHAVASYVDMALATESDASNWLAEQRDEPLGQIIDVVMSNSDRVPCRSSRRDMLIWDASEVASRVKHSAYTAIDDLDVNNAAIASHLEDTPLRRTRIRF